MERFPSLIGRKIAQVAKGLPNSLATVGRHLPQCLTGASYFALPFRRERHEPFVALHHPLSLRGRLHIQAMQTVDDPLLLLRRQAGKAGFAPQRVFLLSRTEILMLGKPLGQVRARTGPTYPASISMETGMAHSAAPSRHAGTVVRVRVLREKRRDMAKREKEQHSKGGYPNIPFCIRLLHRFLLSRIVLILYLQDTEKGVLIFCFRTGIGRVQR